MYATIAQFAKILGGLNTMLDRTAQLADAKKFDAGVILSARLAPDQYPFIKQVQVACDSAKGAAARLAGQEPPKHEDNEKTVDELRHRLKITIDFVRSFQPAQYEGAGERLIKLPWMDGKGLRGHDFLVQMAVPNFYFHTTTAYAILRHNGVDIGKRDFLGSLPLVEK